MEKDKSNMKERKRKTIDGGCKLSFRLNAEEKERFDKMMAETEARDRTLARPHAAHKEVTFRGNAEGRQDGQSYT